LSGGRDAAIVPGSKQTGSGKLEPPPWPLVIYAAAALLCLSMQIVHVLLCGDVREVEHAGAPLDGLD
jgi:hypothetical protein